MLMQQVVSVIIPFFSLLAAGLVILTFFPQICLYLPSRM
jgi:TRAP-type C4-dicarboxylate transport system permease large subunit